MPAVGVDLGGTNIRAAVVDPDGRLLALSRHKLTARAPDAAVGQIAGAIQEALAQPSLDLQKTTGVGIRVAAPLRGESGVVAAGPNQGWNEVPLGDLMRNALGGEVLVVNDVEAITWAEVCYGAARGHQNVLVVVPGTGIGGGLVLDGKLYRGATGVSAEIGHVKVQDSGERCGCGNHGCLEAYLGGANLSRRLRREASAGWSALEKKAGSDLEAIHPGLVEELVAEGDSRACELFEELAGYFGMALANAVTLLNPTALVLGGTLLEGCPTLRARSQDILRERVLKVAGEALEVLKTKLGDVAGVIGAATLVRQETATS